PLFSAGERTVHADGHVEVAGAFYPVPLALLGQRVRVQWNAQLVRVFHADTLAAVHRTVSPGTYAPQHTDREASTRQQGFVNRLLGQCEQVGPALKQWADAALAARGVRAIRLIQGVLGLTRRHPRERVLAAVTEAHTALSLSDHPPARRAHARASHTGARHRRPRDSPDDPVHL